MCGFREHTFDYIPLHLWELARYLPLIPFDKLGNMLNCNMLKAFAKMLYPFKGFKLKSICNNLMAIYM
jgi:hypothetical protein